MANIIVPIQMNLPDDWVEQIVDRLRNDPESEWVQIVRCKECKHRYLDSDVGTACEYTNMYQPGDGYCNWAERR